MNCLTMESNQENDSLFSVFFFFYLIMYFAIDSWNMNTEFLCLFSFKKSL